MVSVCAGFERIEPVPLHYAGTFIGYWLNDQNL